MERRLLTFVLASTAFFFIYFTLRSMVVPQQKVAPAKQLAQADANSDKVADDTKSTAPTVDSAESTKDDSEAALQIERPDDPTWVTLGSMATDSNYRMLVTLNSRGGAVERIELTERDDKGRLKYRRVDLRNGYLGFFAGTPAEKIDGMRVNVVGAGTPAQQAGIEVGDIITSVLGQPITNRESIRKALEKTKPNQQVSIDLIRPASPTDTNGEKLSVNATLSQHPLDLVRLAEDAGEEQIEGNLSRLSFLMTLAQVNRKGIAVGARSLEGATDAATIVWDITEQDSNGVTFEVKLGQSDLEAVGGSPVTLRRTFMLPESSYVLDLSNEVQNSGDENQDLAYRLEGPNGLTLEGWWYSNKISPYFFNAAAARDVVYKSPADGHRLVTGYELLKKANKEPKDPDLTIFAPDSSDNASTLQYIGVDAQYFTVAFLPSNGDSAISSFQRATADIVANAKEVKRHKERAVNTSFFLTSEIASLEPGQSLTQDLRIFAGPKDPIVLEQYGLGDTIYYGWFALFARFLGGILHIIGGLIGNYALAIILLTVLVRGLMFPLSRKAAVNAQRMQELAPELKKIAEKYKDDMEGRLKAQRELQQRVGFNPMAGCLPMFLQLPIFIGLYRALSVDIELRQKTFSSATNWASNLAGPDMFSYWGDWLWEYFSGRGTGWLGPYFNILPVIVVGLFLLQQKMFMPPATDEQTAMTQKMMNIMTLFMGLFFFRVPAGLCIYFITSSLWGICERVIVKKTLPAKKHFDPNVIEGTATPTEKKAPESKTIAERIREQVSKPEEKFERPNKRRRPVTKKKR